MKRRSVSQSKPDIIEKDLFQFEETTPTHLNSTKSLANADSDDDDIPDTQPVPILNDVVAFVDVRTKNDNRSRGISCVLEQLGARVEEKFTNDVTHVIFKEGMKMTINKATKKGIHLVSVLWIDQCMKNEQRVSEKLYPALIPEHANGTPIFTGRLKKLKSMQPNDFEEDVARSAETCKIRRKRIETMNRFRMCDKTPSCYSSLPVLVQETQPRSPHPTKSDWQTPEFLSIPDTPLSIRDKLLEMQQAKRDGTPFSPFSRKNEESSPPIKKLFGDGYEDFSDSEDEDPVNKPKMNNVREAVQSAIEALEKETGVKLQRNPFLTNVRNYLQSQSDSNISIPQESIDSQENKQINNDNSENGSAQNTNTSSSPKPIVKRKKKLINLSAPVQPNSFLVEATHSSCDTDRPDLLNSNKKCKQLNKDNDNLSRRNKQRVEKRKIETENSSPEHQTKNKRTKRVLSDPSSDGTITGKQNAQPPIQRRKSTRLSGINMNIQESVTTRNTSSVLNQTDITNNSRCSAFDSSTRTNNGDASMSMVYGDTTFASITGLPSRRQSIDEFSVGKAKKSRKGKVTRLLTSVHENDGNEKENNVKNVVSGFVKIRNLQKDSMESSSSSDQSSGKWTSKDDKCKANSVRLRTANSFVMEKSPDGPRTRPSLVMTRLHADEQDTVVSIIQKLTGFIIQDTVTDTTTHIVLGDGRRTLNVINGIARGCWLINKEWALQSYEAKKWLEEEKYEATDKFPSCQVTRLERQKQGVNYKQNLFSDVGQICISYKCVPPRGSLSVLVKLCGGQVTGSVARAKIYIGEDSRPHVINLKPIWILDCITEHKLLPYDKYLNETLIPKRESSPEF